MNKAIKVLVVALILFAAAAGASWFMQQKLRSETPHPAAEATEKPIKLAPVPSANAPRESKITKAAVRPPFVPESDSVSKMAASLQQQLESVKGREQELANRQKSLDLIYQNIRSEQRTLDEVRKQINDELKLLSDKMNSLDNKSVETKQLGLKVAKQEAELQRMTVGWEKDEATRIKTFGSAFNTMPPEAAAQQMQDMVEQGKLDMAVKILGSMQERQMARLLAALPDSTVAVQLLDRLKGLKSPNQKTP